MASEMASNQVKRNIEMAALTTRSFLELNGILTQQSNSAIEKAIHEMVASAEKARTEMIALAERARQEMLTEILDSIERMKNSFLSSSSKKSKS
jgi:low affinity Fe/Cu permease